MCLKVCPLSEDGAQNSPRQASTVHEPPDVQVGFRKGRGTRDQIANIRWIIEKAKEFQKNIYFCFIDYAKAFDCVKVTQLCLTLRPHRRQPTRLPRPWDSPGKNTGVGCRFLLQCMKVTSESYKAYVIVKP